VPGTGPLADGLNRTAALDALLTVTSDRIGLLIHVSGELLSQLRTHAQRPYFEPQLPR